MNRRERRAAAARRRRGRIREAPAPWSIDDRRWFEANPARSHRLRSAFEGELSDFRPLPLPPHHETQILVRQFEPGLRLRLPFRRNVQTPIPDCEAIVHALFDLVAADGPPITVQDVARLAEQYEAAESRGPS